MSRARIRAEAMGRPLISEFESDMRTHLQTAVVTQYGVLTDKAVYFFDSSLTQHELAEAVLKMLRYLHHRVASAQTRKAQPRAEGFQ